MRIIFLGFFSKNDFNTVKKSFFNVSKYSKFFKKGFFSILHFTRICLKMRWKRLLLLVALSVSQCSLAAQCSVGVYSDNAIGSDYGSNIDRILLFQDAKKLRFDYIQKRLDAGFKVTLVMEFRASYPCLDAITAGSWDDDLKRFSADARNDGRVFTVRALHEVNGDWYPWGALRQGNSPEQCKRAFRHIVDVFRNEGVRNVKFQFGFNVTNARLNKTPFSAFYPGNDYVDSIAISCYNRATQERSSRSFADLFQPAYDAVQGLGSRAICIGEMATTSHCDKAQWIKDAFDAVRYRFTRVNEMDWFLENKNGNDWDLNSEQQRQAFADGSRNMGGGAGDERFWIIGEPYHAAFARDDPETVEQEIEDAVFYAQVERARKTSLG
jgi:hypothetical protein